MLRQLEQVPYVKNLVKRLERDPCPKKGERMWGQGPHQGPLLHTRENPDRVFIFSIHL